jgi:acyl transferase domain-containing protein
MTHSEPSDERDLYGIAIIGMAGRFPDARNVREFWDNLTAGREAIRPYSEEELDSAGVDETARGETRFVNSGSVMPDADSFDASFFEFTAREAEIMDPQHRVLLETAWEALEDAGLDPDGAPGSIGVFAGVGPNTYLLRNLATRPELLEMLGRYAVILGNEKEYAVTRVSYKLNLTGPSFAVSTACSTSGVAIHLACQSLLSGECDVALAGGGKVGVPLISGYVYQEGGILSPDGRCRAFDSEARGTVGGNGVGIVVLKRLSEAIEDGDHVYAVIKGSAVNNDGSQKVGFTAPSIQGQAAVISEALAIAGVDPESVGYVEAHGTGTSLGDPIEVAALTEAYRRWTDRKAFCRIGSVKTNVGHLDAGAGVTGVIKTTLALKHNQIPPSLHYQRPNPEIDFANSPFTVNSELSSWPASVAPRRAGVSSFGLGGTNVHIILEEAPETEPSGPSRSHQLLLLSARTDAALAQATENLAEHLRQSPGINLADVAYTLQTGRRAFNLRRAAVCQSSEDALSVLAPLDPSRVATSVQEPVERDVVFMFSGQGSQHVNMGLDLYESEPVFRQQIDHCADILGPSLPRDLREILYPDDTDLEEAAWTLQQTSFTQPALFAVEYALAKLWLEWGIQPRAMVGHSIGEYVAACLAGVFSLEDGLALVASRGHLIQGLPSGSMLAVSLPPGDVLSLLDGKLDLAVINAPSLCVVSGERGAVEALEAELVGNGVGCRQLHTSHAFHSRMMEPIVGLFERRVGQLRLKPPSIPFVSNVSGTWIRPDEATSPGYWAAHLRQTVRFSDCVQELLKEPNRVLLEVGPGRTLSTLAQRHPDRGKAHVVLSSARHPKEQRSDVAFILNTVGQLWLAGTELDWSGFYAHERRLRLPLPTYPFQRKRYWIDPKPREAATTTAGVGAPVTWEMHVADEPDVGQESSSLPAGAPQSAVERTIAGIWEVLLGISGLSIYDSFFDLGGSSLLATRVLTQVGDAFGQKLPLATIFEAPTVAELAAVIERARASEDQPSQGPDEARQLDDAVRLLGIS